jgi:hypothetical protein
MSRACVPILCAPSPILLQTAVNVVQMRLVLNSIQTPTTNPIAMLGSRIFKLLLFPYYPTSCKTLNTLCDLRRSSLGTKFEVATTLLPILKLVYMNIAKPQLFHFFAITIIVINSLF